MGFPVAQVFLTLRKAADAKKDIDSFSKAEKAVRQLTVACPCDLCRPPTHRLPVIDLPLGPVPPMLPEARPPRNASAPFTVYCEWHGIMATQATRKLSELNIDKVCAH